MKRATFIQMIFILKMELQKENFLAKYDFFFADLRIHFEPLLGWECPYLCHV